MKNLFDKLLELDVYSSDKKLRDKLSWVQLTKYLIIIIKIVNHTVDFAVEEVF